MSDHNEERDIIATPVASCVERLKLTFGDAADEQWVLIKLENLCFEILRRARARNAFPPPIPLEARRKAFSMEQAERPTDPIGLPRGVIK
jgi:hypothetical protein